MKKLTSFFSRDPRSSLRVRFVKDVFVFGWANVASLVLNGALSFILPRYMTVENFGYYRLFILYASLAGIAHLGMLEGILVRWAEKPEDRIGREIKGAFEFLLLLQVILLTPVCVALCWVHAGRWFWFSLGLAVYVLICNCSMLGEIALQSRRQFNQLSLLTVLPSSILFCLIVAWQVAGHLTARTAITSFVIANLITALGMWKFALEPGANPARTPREIFQFGLDNTQIGWKILAANIFLTFTPSLDRFFVSSTFPICEFAIYAFAGNALAIVYTIAISSAQVVYPYLSGGTGPESRRRAYEIGRSMILGLWAVSLVLYFPTAFLVQSILPKYSPSLPLVRLLMISSGFVGMIHILHANYFRVNLALNRFLLGSVVGLSAVALLLMIASRGISLLRVAAAMTTGILIWWATNETLLAKDLGTPRMGWIRTFILWLLCSAAFLTACTIHDLWLGGLVYGGACFLVLALGLRDIVRRIFSQMSTLTLQSEPAK